MTKNEALTMCLEYIETNAHERKYVRHAIKQALSDIKQDLTPVQKPRLDQGADYERGFIDGMQKQMQSSVDKAVNAMSQPAPVQDADGEALVGDIDLLDHAREVLEIIVHDQPVDVFRDARGLIPRLRARLGMPPIINFTTAPAAPVISAGPITPAMQAWPTPAQKDQMVHAMQSAYPAAPVQELGARVDEVIAKIKSGISEKPTALNSYGLKIWGTVRDDLLALATPPAAQPTTEEYWEVQPAPVQEPEPVAWDVFHGVCHHSTHGTESSAKAMAAEMQKNHDLSGSIAAFSVKPRISNPPTAAQPADSVPMPTTVEQAINVEPDLHDLIMDTYNRLGLA